MKKGILLIITIILLLVSGYTKKENYRELLKELIEANSSENRQSLYDAIYREHGRFSYYIEGEYQEENCWIDEASYGDVKVLLYCCQDLSYALIDNEEFAYMITDFSNCYNTWEKDTLGELLQEKVLDVSTTESEIIVTTQSKQSIGEEEEEYLAASYLRSDISRFESIYVFDAKTKVLKKKSVIIVYKDKQMQMMESVILEYDVRSDVEKVDAFFRGHYEEVESFRNLTFVVEGEQHVYRIPAKEGFYSDLLFRGKQYEIDYLNSVFDNENYDNDVIMYLVEPE
ncbi:MAG: hypothetical protein II126_01660 [Erysipelotrichaceae bacterium]|nr:hypothetical protein [Erysipelotrichaceae bacterium]